MSAAASVAAARALRLDPDRIDAARVLAAGHLAAEREHLSAAAASRARAAILARTWGFDLEELKAGGNA